MKKKLLPQLDNIGKVMRTLSAILFVAVSLSSAQLMPSAKHNQFIELNLNRYNNDDHIIRSDISVPDVVVNRHHISSEDIVEKLKEHVKEAAEHFLTLDDTEKLHASIDLPQAIHSSQWTNNNGKRSVNEDVDYEATAELYKQALSFLDKYDVEMRLN
ncbi:hypothetical protein GCK72_010306 [Caenorhabditis remanei]|nr:hypothetical protein GCK72_010306 [Caenorhabditis remanei]KAF1762044.1 hypothetical protein GCK72_010306 [Caenorhabditis remanei]